MSDAAAFIREVRERGALGPVLPAPYSEAAPQMALARAVFEQVIEDLAGEHGPRRYDAALDWLFSPGFDLWWTVLPGDASKRRVRLALTDRARERVLARQQRQGEEEQEVRDHAA